MDELRQEFKDRLEESLIIAIASDYDLADAGGLETARTYLASLAHAAVLEQAAGFNASGIPFEHDVAESSSSSAGTPANASAQDEILSSAASHSTGTTSSGATQRSSNDSAATLSFPPATCAGDPVDQLNDIFVELSEHEVRLTLRRVNNDFDRAINELLTIQTLKASGELSKGIDAFFRPDDQLGKKSKGKKRAQRAASENLALEENSLENESLDVLTLCQLLDRDVDDIKPVYDAHGKSVPLTASAILEKHLPVANLLKMQSSSRVKHLTSRYPEVPARLVASAVSITEDEPRPTEDLLDILQAHFRNSGQQRRVAVNYTLKPTDDELEGYTVVTNGRRRNQTTKTPTPTKQTFTIESSVVNGDLAAQEARVRAAQESSREASRRGRSDPLHRQAALVQAERAHAAVSRLGDLRVAAAAARQTDPGSVDLHGLLVAEGISLARMKVQAWWDGLLQGGERARRAREEPFRVITGRGLHSAGGSSPMRRGVLKALAADGWIVEVETGAFRVKGLKSSK